MAASMVDASCVVVANAHNPSIVNPDWLSSHEILPDSEPSWELAEPPIATPPMSHVCYQNDVSVVLMSDRLIVGRARAELPTSSVALLAELAANYVRTLKHIPYTGVGTNLTATIEVPDAPTRLMDQFGGNGPWRDELDGVSVKLIHAIGSGCTRQVEISATDLTKAHDGTSTRTTALLLAANYHRESPGEAATLKALACASVDVEDFQAFLVEVEERLGG